MLAAKLAALRGLKTTCCVAPAEVATSASLIYDDLHPEGSLPLTILPVAGELADPAAIEAAAALADGLIVAFDGERTINEGALNVFMPLEGGNLKRVSLMSRSLNGEGMGFFPTAAKTAANFDIWAAGGRAVGEYRECESLIQSRAKAVGAAWTIIRAGTLKGGGKGDADGGGGGEPSFLTPAFYKLGQQDIVNWRLLYDVAALGVKLSAGDTMPGPGFTAALTAQERVGAGDSHRGAVAAALVEALRLPTAENRDFGVAAEEGRSFPGEEKWAELFASA